MSEFKEKLEKLINCCSIENGSDTPDFILASYLAGCLEVFNQTIVAREKWYGREINVKALARQEDYEIAKSRQGEKGGVDIDELIPDEEKP
jgi:hypothetical protein